MKKRKLNVGKTLCVILAVATIIASPFGLANDWLESISIYHDDYWYMGSTLSMLFLISCHNGAKKNSR